MNDSPNCSRTPELDVVVLSAGQSQRLGRPKQHVVLAGESLLQRSLHLAQTLLDAIGSQRKPILISGAFLQQDCELVNHRFVAGAICHHYNHDWNAGMASSMQCARAATSGDGMMVILVDQYRLTHSDLHGLYTQWLKSPRQPVAARFAGTAGPPVIWPACVLTPDSLNNEDQGPSVDSGIPKIDKKLLQASNPVFVDIDHAEIDLDNETDLQTAEAYFNVSPQPE